MQLRKGWAASQRARVSAPNRSKRTTALLLSTATLAVCSAQVTQGQNYTITDLGTLGGTRSSAWGLNDNGQVVGYAYLNGDTTYHAFVWSSGTMTDLATLGGTQSQALAINNGGEVVGYSYTTNNATYHAFRHSVGNMIDLGTLGGSSSFAYAINNAGQIVGDAYNNAGKDRAFSWSSGVMTDLGTLGGSSAYAYGVNDAGQVVGTASTTGDAADRAFRLSGGVMSNLGTLGGPSSYASGMNNNGDVIGLSYVDGTTYHAFRWSGGVMSDLGTLGGSLSGANAINASGQVVGDAYINGTTAHAFVWSGGTMSDLNDLIPAASGWTLSGARAINSAGQITGSGVFGGQERAYLLTPVASAVGWINASGGDWHTPSNWSTNSVPTSATNAPFNLNSAGGYTVTFSADGQAHDLVVQTDKPNLNLSGRSLNIANNVLVAPAAGNNGQLAIENGTVNAAEAYVGGDASTAGGTGVLSIGNSATLNTSAIKIWNGSSVHLAGGTINAASLDTDGHPAGLNWTSGTLHIVDSGSNVGTASALQVSGNLTIGNSGPLGATVPLAASMNLSVDVTLTVDASATLSGSGTVSAGHIVNDGAINQTGGAVTTADLTGNGATTFAAGSVGNLAYIRQSSLTVAGTVVLAPNSTNAVTNRVNALSVTGRLDLAKNKLIVAGQPAGSWNGSSYTGIQGMVQSGRNGADLPLWDGNGIVTSQTDATGGNYTSIGIAQASDVRPSTAGATALWGGQTITGTDTLVMYTYGGDATLDGKINIDDYVKIDSGIAGGYTGWSNGDFNYDGKVSIDDYITVIDANIGNQGSSFPSGDGIDSLGVNAVSAVPEPAGTCAALMFVYSMATLDRRKRQARR
jgi:probable HAF family extracellular repeat protein